MLMKVPKIALNETYSVSRIIKGGWQLAENHSLINRQSSTDDMFRFVEAGITTFDCADIYTGVEELIGRFRKEYKKKFGKTEFEKLHVHTKFVPDIMMLPTISKKYVENIIDRSLTRLGMERLDVVQFHWWDYDIPEYVKTAIYLSELQQKGKIRYVSITNFDGKHLQEILNAGVTILSNQVQYSLLDRRPEYEMVNFCVKNNIALFCYGSVAGGFLSDKYLGKLEPEYPLENRSLTKYKLIIEDFGGWDIFQELLHVLHVIALKHNASITNIATRYILEKPQVAALIIGARSATQINDNMKIFDISLDKNDIKALEKVLQQAKVIHGDIYSLERIKHGKHAGIMKYNLNKE